jgi:hypothetical protein
MAGSSRAHAIRVVCVISARSSACYAKLPAAASWTVCALVSASGRARGNLERHGVHFLTAYVAGV